MVPLLCNAFDLDALRKQGATPVFLIRHGETQWNRERRFLGRSDVPLNNTGQHQAQLLADRLRAVPFNHVYSSPLTRAVETAGGIGATHGLPVERIPGLAELDQVPAKIGFLGQLRKCPVQYVERFGTLQFEVMFDELDHRSRLFRRNATVTFRNVNE